MTDFPLWTSESRTSNSRSIALFGIIGALIMQIYKSHAGTVKHTQMDHLQSYLKLRALAESDVGCSYEPFLQKEREISAESMKMFLH